MAPRLTLVERRLLRFPPTQKTWECLGTRKERRGEETVTVRCGHYNPGTQSSCVLCGKARGSRPHLVYPKYLAACKKAGIEPGQRYTNQLPPQSTPPKKVRRK